MIYLLKNTFYYSEPANLCPQTFESDGILTSTTGEATCDGLPGDTCNVQCPSQVIHTVYCHPNGTWNKTDPCGGNIYFSKSLASGKSFSRLKAMKINSVSVYPMFQFTSFL